MRDMDRTYDTLNERLTAYDAFNDREGVMAVMHGMATHRQGKWLIWSTTGLAILALGAIYAFFLRAIWLPLLRMAEAGHKLVAGDMEAAVPDVNADNELGAMSRAMAMLKALRIASHRTDAEIDNRAAQPGLLAKISRDMRGPINRIIGMTNLLLDTSLNADQRNMAEVVRISSEKLGAVADEVATVSQLIDLMDGTVGVIVKLGDGSTFWFELALPHSANRLIEPVPHPRALLNTAGAM
jgi:signal transduction histidine kinase